MKIKCIVLLLLIMFSLTGCWNYRELNELAIVGSLGIDYNQETKNFEISAQIFNAKKTSSQSTDGGIQSPITVYESSAKTIHEALRNVIFNSPKKLYIGHLQTVIISEHFAKNHLANGLDFLFRDPESRKDFNFAIAKDDKPADILKILTPLESIPSTSMLNSIKTNSMIKGSVTPITYDNFLADLYEPGTEAVLPVISISGNEKKGKNMKNIDVSAPKGDLYISGLAVFKKHKFKGYLDEKESIGYNLIMGNIKNTVISFVCDDKDNYASVELIKAASSVDVKIKKKIPAAKIKLNLEANISEVNCDINLSKPKNVTKLKNKAAKEIKKTVKNTIEVIQTKYNSDIVSFGTYLYLNEYNYWKKNENKWSKIFPKIKSDISVEITLIRKGSIIKTTKEETK